MTPVQASTSSIQSPYFPLADFPLKSSPGKRGEVNGGVREVEEEGFFAIGLDEFNSFVGINVGSREIGRQGLQ